MLLDGAQGLGAVPVDVRALGCDFYAASGQKWLCGPVGSGYLYVSEERIGELMPANPGYGTVEDPLRALDFELCEGAARFDGGLPPSHHSAWALAAIDNLESAGIDTVLTRGPDLAARLAEMLTVRGIERGAARSLDARVVGGRRPRGGVDAAARARFRPAPPAGHSVRARVGGGMVGRGGAGAVGGRRYFWVMTMMPNGHRRHHGHEGHDRQGHVSHRGCRMTIAAHVDRARGAQDRQREHRGHPHSGGNRGDHNLAQRVPVHHRIGDEGHGPIPPPR